MRLRPGSLCTPGIWHQSINCVTLSKFQFSTFFFNQNRSMISTWSLQLMELFYSGSMKTWSEPEPGQTRKDVTHWSGELAGSEVAAAAVLLLDTPADEDSSSLEEALGWEQHAQVETWWLTCWSAHRRSRLLGNQGGRCSWRRAPSVCSLRWGHSRRCIRSRDLELQTDGGGKPSYGPQDSKWTLTEPEPDP